jgi:single-stranded-DNA-specific exonuclease
MSEPLSYNGKQWLWPTTAVPSPSPDLSGDPAFLDALLARRGIASPADRQTYLQPSLKSLLDPSSMAHMRLAVERLLLARAQKQRVMVWGDYDVDGVCATSVLMTFFRQVGIACSYYIPDRRAEGYGLNVAAMAGIAAEHQLLVTVDCGSTSHHEIACAKALGLDTVVVDHHQVLPTLPDAIACINPQRPDCTYPDKGLCAAGLAFMLTVALRRALREQQAFGPHCPEPDVRPMLDMVAVATVADMVPLTGLNRMLVHVGLQRLRTAPRPGLKALCAVAQVPLAQLGAQDLGFRLGPRINARGRMEHAGMAVDLMLCEDPEAAHTMAAALDAANRARRDLEKETVAAAIAQVHAQGLTQDAVLVVAQQNWHAGVLGLVASRLVARFHRPAVVIGEDGKGSGRSVPGLDLHQCLTGAKETMERFGGHPAAAGLTILPANVAALRERLCMQVEKLLGAPPYVPVVRPDLEVSDLFLRMDLFDQLGRLAPFGMANPEPLLAARNQVICERRKVGDDHLKLRLGAKGYDAIGFGMAHLLPELGSHVDVLFYMDKNVWQGQTRLQMRIADLRCVQPA